MKNPKKFNALLNAAETRFVVRADEKLTAFLGLAAAVQRGQSVKIRNCYEIREG